MPVEVLAFNREEEIAGFHRTRIDAPSAHRIRALVEALRRPETPRRLPPEPAQGKTPFELAAPGSLRYATSFTRTSIAKGPENTSRNFPIVKWNRAISQNLVSLVAFARKNHHVAGPAFSIAFRMARSRSGSAVCGVS